MKNLFVLFPLCLALLLSPAAFAHSYQQGDIHIGHCWARATAAGAKTGAVYVPLLNKGVEEDKLVSASTPVAEHVGLHESVKENGIAKMKALDFITLEPGKPVTLRPGGLHIMLMGLKQPLIKGERFPLTLHFEKAGEAQIEAVIDEAGAMGGGHRP